MKPKLIPRTCFYIMLLLIVVCYVAFPFIWMFLNSLKMQKDIMNPDKMFIFAPTLTNYIKIFSKYEFLKPIVNSTVVAALTTLGSLIIGLPCAYAAARYKLRKISVFVLLIRAIPTMTFVIPLYILVSRLGLMDTYGVLVICHMTTILPFIIWIMAPFFETLPVSLEEAAMIDGCGPYARFIKIALPMARAGIITCIIMSFIFSWNHFLFSMIMCGKHTQTITIAMFQFMTYAQVDWGGLMAGAVCVTFPIILLSLCTQKYIVQGLTAGAVKG